MADFLINPNIAKSLLLTGAGLILTALPGALDLGKTQTALSLTLATACFGSSIAFSRRWEKDEAAQGRMEIVEATVVDAQLVAQTMGVIEESKRQYLPHLYVEPARVQQQPDRALPASQDEESIAPANQFQELDLAKAAAQSDKSLLVSGITGVGKTRFLQHFIHAVDIAYSKAAVLDVITFKSTKEHFCGLERSPYYIESGASGNNYDQASNKIASVMGLLDEYESEVPYYLICDEVNNGLKQAEGYVQKSEEGRVIKTGKQSREDLQRSLSFIITQGRERKIRGCFTAHGNLMELLGIDSNTAQSLVCAVLGRKVDQGDGFSLIERLLETANGGFFTKSARSKLAAEFPAIKAQASTDGRAIALTNISGQWEFVFLPTHYKHDPGTIKLEAQNQGISQLKSLSDEQIDSIASDILTKDLDPRARLERDWQAETPKDIDPSEMTAEELNQLIDERRSQSKSSLSKPAQVILNKYQEKELYGVWIDAKWVKNHSFRSKDLIQFSAEDIRGFLIELAQSGSGSVEGEGASLRWYLDNLESE